MYFLPMPGYRVQSGIRVRERERPREYTPERMTSGRRSTMSTQDFDDRRCRGVGRFYVDLELKNNADLILVSSGVLSPERVRTARIRALVDTGATRLVLPPGVVAALGLQRTDLVAVRYADGRRQERDVVGQVFVEIEGRASVFTAIVEPGRDDAVVGAIVLEELDFIADCAARKLVPRDPDRILAEIEEVA
jgi:predicted aspartyl protease